MKKKNLDVIFKGILITLKKLFPPKKIDRLKIHQLQIT